MHMHIQMRAMEEWDGEGHGRVGCVLQMLDENITHSDPQNGNKEQ